MTARKQKNVTLEAAFKLFQSLGVSLQRPFSLGLIGESEDIIQRQAESLIAVSRILSAAFHDG